MKDYWAVPSINIIPLAKLASPIDHITSACPPFLILHGAADLAVLPSESAAFAAALGKAGVSAQIVFLPNQTHNLNVWAKSGKDNYLKLILDFFDANSFPLTDS